MWRMPLLGGLMTMTAPLSGSIKTGVSGMRLSLAGLPSMSFCTCLPGTWIGLLGIWTANFSGMSIPRLTAGITMRLRGLWTGLPYGS